MENGLWRLRQRTVLRALSHNWMVHGKWGTNRSRRSYVMCRVSAIFRCDIAI